MAATTLMSLPTEPSALLAAAPRMVGRFSIRAEIGRGSNGVVYSAFDPVLSREVAIKAIPLTHDRKWSERIEANFLNEAKAAAGLNHPHIVTVFDAGKTESIAYLAMERLYGRDLHEVIVAGQHFNPRQVASLLTRVADAVHFAHKRGLVHRDIKPSNIFIQRDGKPKVLDFGVALAHMAESGGTEKRQLIGTPNYMSPEQALGRKLDARSDVFSIGTILYELLAGRRAFDGNTIDETLAQVISDMPAPIDAQKSAIPQRLIDICNKALEKDIEKRYQTAGDLRNDLAAFAGQPATSAANQSNYGTLGGSRVLFARAGNLLWRQATPRSIAIAAIAALLIVGWLVFSEILQPPPPAEVAAPQPPPLPTPIVTEPEPIALAPAETRAPPVEQPKSPRKLVRPTRTDTASAQSLAAAEGTVSLAVTPWGEVFVDGATRGVSPPLNRLSLPPGPHVIEVRNGAAPAYSARVEVKPGQTLTLQHHF
ncbi:MAG TPA: serine/threonine-protein kinase [Burkholderiaceae bacterium]|nr:serine/threonine-protein kinase [Burkholderiaceae bacterium]